MACAALGSMEDMRLIATRIAPAALAAGLLSVLAPPAGAADPSARAAFDAFAQVCGDTHVDYAAALAALDAHGWKTAEVQATTLAGVKVSDRVSRATRVGGTDLTMFAWRGATNAKIQVSACTVRVSSFKSVPLKAEAQAWAGFAPQGVDAKKVTFQFTDDGAVHRALAKGDYDAASAGAGLEMFTVSADGPDTILDLLKIRK